MLLVRQIFQVTGQLITWLGDRLRLLQAAVARSRRSQRSAGEVPSRIAGLTSNLAQRDRHRNGWKTALTALTALQQAHRSFSCRGGTLPDGGWVPPLAGRTLNLNCHAPRGEAREGRCPPPAARPRPGKQPPRAQPQPPRAQPPQLPPHLHCLCPSLQEGYGQEGSSLAKGWGENRPESALLWRWLPLARPTLMTTHDAASQVLPQPGEGI